MGRAVLYTVIALLALFVLSTSVVLEHGGGYTAGAAETTVHDLLMEPERYRGHEVTAEGTLKFDATTGGYMLAADGQGVLVRYSRGSLAAFAETLVRVSGRFDWEPGTGVFIQASVIAPVNR
jgi:hypothetical protein